MADGKSLRIAPFGLIKAYKQLVASTYAYIWAYLSKFVVH